MAGPKRGRPESWMEIAAQGSEFDERWCFRRAFMRRSRNSGSRAVDRCGPDRPRTPQIGFVAKRRPGSTHPGQTPSRERPFPANNHNDLRSGLRAGRSHTSLRRRDPPDAPKPPDKRSRLSQFVRSNPTFCRHQPTGRNLATIGQTASKFGRSQLE